MRKLFFANPHTTKLSNPWNLRAIKWQVASSVWPKAHIIVTADNPQQALIQPSYRRNCCHLHCCCCCSGSVGTVRQPFRDDVFEKCEAADLYESGNSNAIFNQRFSSVDLHASWTRDLSSWVFWVKFLSEDSHNTRVKVAWPCSHWAMLDELVMICRVSDFDGSSVC